MRRSKPVSFTQIKDGTRLHVSPIDLAVVPVNLATQIRVSRTGDMQCNMA